MASIIKEPNGRKRIEFVLDGKRPRIRLGKMAMRDADRIKTRFEALLASKTSGCPWDSETAEWVGTMPDDLAGKLARLGLIPERRKAAGETLGAFLDSYIDGRAGLKPNTLRNYQQTRRMLLEHFGRDKRVADVTPGDADAFKEWLVANGKAQATISREVKRARQFFRAAVRHKLIAENPFAEVKGGKQENRDRYYFVSRAEADAVLAACPDLEWRLIFALARYGGLRTPSETLALRWGDIDWERDRMRVRSPKTEGHPDGAFRWVPMFPELRPLLEAAFDAAPPRTEHVISRYRQSNVNLRSRLLDIIWRAELKEWPKLFQNLRSSRETELTEDFPMHVVCAWIGNSAPVAAKHYLQVTEEHFKQAIEGSPEAAQNAAQYPSETGGTEREPKEKGPVIPEEYEPLLLCTLEQVPPRGVEPLSSD